MSWMFYGASAFNHQDLSAWNVGSVLDHDDFMTGAGSGNREPIWNAFIITVKTDNPGTSNDNQFTIPTDVISTYNYNVDCDDDGVDEATGITGNYTCNYATAGTYRVIIKGNQANQEGVLSYIF